MADVFALEGLGRTFDVALDCGLFHVFDDHERPVYAASVAGVVRPGGSLHMLCFSERQPPGPGPRRVSEPGDPRRRSRMGGRFARSCPSIFETNFEEPDVQAWRATIDRIGLAVDHTGPASSALG